MKRIITFLPTALIFSLVLSLCAFAADEGIISNTKDGITVNMTLAAENENVRAEVYDLTHFPALREQYNVMSVPCLVINDGETVTFGKKNLRQLLELLN